MSRRRIMAGVLLLCCSSGVLSGKEKGPRQDKYIEVGDIKIHYLEAGDGERPLVFIPDWTMPAEVWREQIPYFSARGFRVIAVDPRGQGSTTRTESGNTYQQHAADLHAFLQALKIEHSYLVGWGAGTATLLDYISSPEALKPEKMVFVGGGPALLKMEDYPGLMTMQQARTLVLALDENRAKATEQLVRSLFKQRPTELVVNDLTLASRKTPLSAALLLYIDLLTGDRRPALRHIAVPTLMIATDENRAVGEYMKARIPRSALEIIEGAGQAPFLEKPQTFNQILESFLGER